MYYEILAAKNSPNEKQATPDVTPVRSSMSSIQKSISGLVRYEEVMPPHPRDSGSSLRMHSNRDTVGSSEENSAKPQAAIDSSARKVEQKSGASWKLEYSRLADEIHLRHYSVKTLETYQGWMKKFQTFTRSKAPELLSSNDDKEFLTFLAVKRNVSATTQNQAFNSLLFLFRHVLHKEFGKIDGVVRAKRKPFIPVVLSREEIDGVIKYLTPPYDLAVKLLYGCGIRLFECLRLRVQLGLLPKDRV